MRNLPQFSVDNPVIMGIVGDECGIWNSATGPGLSERGLLYSPSELLR